MRRVMDRLTRICGLHFGPNAAAEWVLGSLLTRGKQEAVAIGAGGTNDTDIQVGGDGTLVLQVQMTGAAAGDLTAVMFPFEADNLTIMPIAIPPMNSIGPTLNGGKVYYYAEFDVSSLERVRLRLTNNNVGAQTIDRMSWKLTG